MFRKLSRKRLITNNNNNNVNNINNNNNYDNIIIIIIIIIRRRIRTACASEPPKNWARNTISSKLNFCSRNSMQDENVVDLFLWTGEY